MTSINDQHLGHLESAKTWKKPTEGDHDQSAHGEDTCASPYKVENYTVPQSWNWGFSSQKAAL